MIEPFCQLGRRGRHARAIDTMPMMYMLRNWFNLADGVLEDAAYDSYSFGSFFLLDFFDEQVHDATALLKILSLLEKHKIGEETFADAKERLGKTSLMMHGGSIVDATVICSLCINNMNCKRNPEMHQAKKGNLGYFGMRI